MTRTGRLTSPRCSKQIVSTECVTGLKFLIISWHFAIMYLQFGFFFIEGLPLVVILARVKRITKDRSNFTHWQGHSSRMIDRSNFAHSACTKKVPISFCLHSLLIDSSSQALKHDLDWLLVHLHLGSGIHRSPMDGYTLRVFLLTPPHSCAAAPAPAPAAPCSVVSSV